MNIYKTEGTRKVLKSDILSDTLKMGVSGCHMYVSSLFHVMKHLNWLLCTRVYLLTYTWSPKQCVNICV